MAKLRNPAALNEQAPATFKANFDTSKGTFVIEVHRDWAPIGADRFYNLVKNGFFDDVRFFRVISGFMAQFGIHGNPGVQSAWRDANLKDDPVRQSNKRGYRDVRAPPDRTRARRSSSSTSGTTRGSTSRDSRRSARSCRAWTSSTSSTRIRRRRTSGQRAGPGPSSVGRERVSDQGISEARLHQERDDRQVREMRSGALTSTRLLEEADS